MEHKKFLNSLPDRLILKVNTEGYPLSLLNGEYISVEKKFLEPYYAAPENFKILNPDFVEIEEDEAYYNEYFNCPYNIIDTEEVYHIGYSFESFPTGEEVKIETIGEFSHWEFTHSFDGEWGEEHICRVCVAAPDIGVGYYSEVEILLKK